MFEEKPVNAKNECLGEPCAYCDVEWCSIACFKRRGYEWDSFHRFIKGSDNKPLRRNIETIPVIELTKAIEIVKGGGVDA